MSVHTGLVAYAAGDALGVPWEGCAPGDVDGAALDTLPARAGWPRGATSDDTAITLLLAEVLGVSGGEEARFLAALAEALPSIRGVGPSTSAAVARHRETGALVAAGGATNGAAMRALAVGWAAPDAAERAELSDRIARTTHTAPQAVAAARIVADLGAQALAGAPLDVPDDLPPVPAEGVPLDALPTVAAVVSVLRRGLPLAESLRAAVALGGDTDTVAALVGGILGCRLERIELPWLDGVLLPDGIERAAVALDARAGRPLRDRARAPRR